jgi:hypothetical protein
MRGTWGMVLLSAYSRIRKNDKGVGDRRQLYLN